MSAARVVAEFDRLSNAPDAVPRLRRFILDLAVRGKLVVQHAGSVRTETTLGSVGGWSSGGTPSRSHPEYFGGTIPWVVIGDLNDGVVCSTAESITDLGLSSSSAKLVEAGAVLIAMYGAIGKLGIAGVTCATNQAIAHCVPDPDVIESRYLFLLLRSLRSDLVARGQGGAQQNINQMILKSWPVRLPPVAEQQRIVVKVDELMALCDGFETTQSDRERNRDRLTSATWHGLRDATCETARLSESREAVTFALRCFRDVTAKTSQLPALRRAILDLALRGRLVEQDSSEEPASELLTRISLERRRLGLASASRSTGVRQLEASTAVDFTVPRGWATTSLGETIRLLSGQHLKPDEYSSDVAEGVPYITGPADFGREGLVITRYAIVAKAVATQGQILLTVKGAGVGKTAICNLPQVAISRQLMAMEPILWSSAYLLLLAHLLTARLVSRMRSLIPGISRDDVNSFAIALPPLAEQHRIVAKVEQLRAVCEALERSLTEAQTGRARLLEAVLHEALTEVGVDSERVLAGAH